ncbi:hypothetical protein FHU33_4604 [Blastococcus colisei]|uniref:Uncharacterized protein n=1 Tax=Blastococcus colisei TaxID=1564162 RepID=A0A543P1J0_9ACTN|nr:hypothetical protein [Blastococcus colisei]TQN37931.1 hypothetical protein FHU33_4604 [Blastococcus colisei]
MSWLLAVGIVWLLTGAGLALVLGRSITLGDARDPRCRRIDVQAAAPDVDAGYLSGWLAGAR